jgi:hypothetical protein
MQWETFGKLFGVPRRGFSTRQHLFFHVKRYFHHLVKTIKVMKNDCLLPDGAFYGLFSKSG